MQVCASPLLYCSVTRGVTTQQSLSFPSMLVDDVSYKGDRSVIGVQPSLSGPSTNLFLLVAA